MPEDLNVLFKQVSDVGAAQGAPKAVGGGVPFIIIPQGYQKVSLADQIYNDHQSNPQRKKAEVEVDEPESFLEYWKGFADSNSQIFADSSSGHIVGILDYHEMLDGSPRWGQHTLTLTLTTSDEWKEWGAKNKAPMSQTEFSEFLEDHAPDIVNPNAATFIEAARDLKAKSDVAFASKVEMKDGSVQFGYTENVKGTYGNGSVEIPERFDISIPIYLGTAPVTVSVRLRYRINSGKLTMWYDLYRASYMQREAFQQVVEDIATGIEKKVFIGRP
jgi:uncharacterized protein YfdQ (DUF2303 family)